MSTFNSTSRPESIEGRGMALAALAAAAMPPASSAAAAVPRINQHVKVETAPRRTMPTDRAQAREKKDFRPDRNRKRREDGRWIGRSVRKTGRKRDDDVGATDFGVGEITKIRVSATK